MSMQCFFVCKSQFREKNLVLPIENFRFLAVVRNTIILQHLLSVFRSIICQVVRRLRQVKNKGGGLKYSDLISNISPVLSFL